MKTKTKIIAGVIAAALLLVVILIGAIAGGVYFVDRKLNDPVRRAKLNKAWDDGEIFGKTTDQNGCMAKALSFTDAADPFDLSNNDFDHACFGACAASAGFCDGAELGFGGHWPEDQCGEKKQNREACITAYERKQFFCRLKSGL